MPPVTQSEQLTVTLTLLTRLHRSLRTLRGQPAGPALGCWTGGGHLCAAHTTGTTRRTDVRGVCHGVSKICSTLGAIHSPESKIPWQWDIYVLCLCSKSCTYIPLMSIRPISRDDVHQFPETVIVEKRWVQRDGSFLHKKTHSSYQVIP